MYDNDTTRVTFLLCSFDSTILTGHLHALLDHGLEYLPSKQVIRVRFPGGAHYFFHASAPAPNQLAARYTNLKMESAGIDPATSRMLSERSTI